MANAIQIDWDRTTDGYAFFLGPKEDKKKLGVMGTKHDQGLKQNGYIVMQEMPRETWGLHFTSASVPLDILKAIVDSIPTEP